MILVDTSVWVEIFKDKAGHFTHAFRERIGSDHYVLSRFNQLELLQGARDQKEYELLEGYLFTQYYLEASENTWGQAARINFELRRKGVTIGSPIDCCIAQIAMEHGALLLHRDKDFEAIARIRPLEQERFKRP
jgi:predicted nucleic acid-binding protein